jgi:hypothetical protein
MSLTRQQIDFWIPGGCNFVEEATTRKLPFFIMGSVAIYSLYSLNILIYSPVIRSCQGLDIADDHALRGWCLRRAYMRKVCMLCVCVCVSAGASVVACSFSTVRCCRCLGTCHSPVHPYSLSRARMHTHTHTARVKPGSHSQGGRGQFLCRHLSQRLCRQLRRQLSRQLRRERGMRKRKQQSRRH